LGGHSIVYLSPDADSAKVENNPVLLQSITLILGLSTIVNDLDYAPIEID